MWNRRKKTNFPLLALACLVWLTAWSCVKPKLTRRYKTITRQAVQSGERLVLLSAFVMEKPDDPKSTLFKLSDRGQAALITEMGKSLQTADELLSKLHSSSVVASDEQNLIDKTIFQKRVVFSVEKNKDCASCTGGDLSLADRIRSLKVVLSFGDEDGGEPTGFRSWDRFSTEYQTVDLGDVTLDRESGDLLTLAGPQDYNTATSGTKRELTEEVSLTQRYVVLSGRLSESQAILYLEGVTGIDLAGNFIVDFQLEVPEGDLISTVIPKGLWNGETHNRPEKVSLTVEHRKIPKSSRPRMARLSYDYTLRHVTDGEATIGEDDDRVVLLEGNVDAHGLEILTQKELQAVFYSLAVRGGDDGSESKVHLSGPLEIPLYFNDIVTANHFLEWLKQTKSAEVGAYRLVLDQKPLAPETIGRLFVKRIVAN